MRFWSALAQVRIIANILLKPGTCLSQASEQASSSRGPFFEQLFQQESGLIISKRSSLLTTALAMILTRERLSTTHLHQIRAVTAGCFRAASL